VRNQSFSIKRALASMLVLLLLYLSFWPVPVKPVSWSAPQNAGLVDPFAPNDTLASARTLNLGDHQGPEDIAGGPDGLVYASTNAGDIVRFDPGDLKLEVFAHTGGRPLGLEFDQHGNLFVANALLGLQRVAPSGIVEILLDRIDGRPFEYANDVAVSSDGNIYVTQSTQRFPVQEFGGTYESSVLDILEHSATGRVIEFNAKTGDARVIMDGLNFANGIAISHDQRFLLVNETASYKVWRYWLRGPDTGASEFILENLPGFPDNLNNGLNERFWLGLVAPRNEIIDALSDKPILRKVIQRLPAFIRPKIQPSSHLIGIDGDGLVLMNLQDGAARFPAITGAFETRDHLYLSTLFGNELAIVDKTDLKTR
jgi:sugar lactone lactonase YvrE